MRIGLEHLALGQEGTAAEEERLARLRADLEEECARREREGDYAGAAIAALNAGRLLGLRGRWSDAMPLLERSLALAESHGHPQISLYAHLHLRLAALDRRQPADARAHCVIALRLAVESHDRSMQNYCLEELVGVVVAEGEPRQAARLAGAAVAARTLHGAPLTGSDQALFDSWIATARAQLDAASWQEAWAAGHALSLEEAVTQVLQDLELRDIPQADPALKG